MVYNSLAGIAPVPMATKIRQVKTTGILRRLCRFNIRWEVLLFYILVGVFTGGKNSASPGYLIYHSLTAPIVFYKVKLPFLCAVMPLAGGQDGFYPTRNFGFLLTLFQPGGDRLWPPHYCLPTRIWKPNGISEVGMESVYSGRGSLLQ